MTTRAQNTTVANLELVSLLEHLNTYDLALIQIVIVNDRYETTLSGNIPSRELPHLNLEQVS